MEPLGLSPDSRALLSKLLRDNPQVVTISNAADSLGLTPALAARRLAAWSRAGWLARVRRGVYVPVPIEAESPDVALDDAWVVAKKMFEPCYIGGWSAAEHWGLTEQIFGPLCVMTELRPRNRNPVLRKTKFNLHTVPTSHFMGLKTVWRNGIRVQVSDPARTLIDMLANPDLGGGIRHVTEMLANFLHDHPKDVTKLKDYSANLEIGAIYKRLGFLLQRDHPEQFEMIDICRSHLTTGYAKLDPALPTNNLVTEWRV